MTDICKGCGKPIGCDDARYCGRSDEDWHWDCYQEKRSADAPTPGSFVIQVDTGFGGWADLTASPRRDVIDAVMTASRRRAKGRRVRLVQVLK